MAITINGTNTAANPGITGADTDTGLSFGTNEVSINTDGTERFRVGSAGQFGIGGATYGTSGQFLQSQGASAAPQWATVTTTQITAQNSVPTTSGTSIVLGNIPAAAKRVLIGFKDVSFSASNALQLRLGTSASIASSGYDAVTARIYDGTSQGVDSYTYSTHFKFEWSTSNYGYEGYWLITNVTGNQYAVQGQLSIIEGSWRAICFSGGGVTLSDSLEQVEIFGSSGGTFNGGNIRLFYEE